MTTLLSCVISAPVGADNATSGPISILCNATQWREAISKWGGEAKEAEPTSILAKPVCKRSVKGGLRW